MRMSVAIAVATVGLAISAVTPFTVASAQTQSGASAPRAVPNVDTPADSARARPRVRIHRNVDSLDVSPRYYPGPNAVRDCRAHLVQEFRPSGTVIVPRMDCRWIQG